MTNPNLTHIVAILDRSGSMSTIKTDTEGGFDAFIAEQAKVEGECKVTLVQFDTDYEVVYSNRDVKEVPSLELQPRYWTALHDALGRAVTEKGRELRNLPENRRPGSVIVLVLTDGLENSSKEWSKSAVRKLIEEQQDKWNWTFVFLGANQDAVLTGTDLGFRPGYSLTYGGEYVMNALQTTASNIGNYRTARMAGISHDVAVLDSSFTEDDRKEALTGTTGTSN